MQHSRSDLPPRARRSCSSPPTSPVTATSSKWRSASRGPYGRIDVLVNNAPVYRDLGTKVAFDPVTNEIWDHTMIVTVRGAWQCSKAAVPYMRRHGGGTIVNLASVVALSGVAGFVHYAASNSAVIGLTRGLARELGPDKITVTAIAPGMVATESSRGLNPNFEQYATHLRQIRALARDLDAGDLVGALIFLASSGSDLITGQTLVVDGGDGMT